MREIDNGRELISFHTTAVLSANGWKGAISPLFPCIAQLLIRHCHLHRGTYNLTNNIFCRSVQHGIHISKVVAVGIIGRTCFRPSAPPFGHREDGRKVGFEGEPGKRRRIDNGPLKHKRGGESQGILFHFIPFHAQHKHCLGIVCLSEPRQCCFAMQSDDLRCSDSDQ